MLFIVSPKLSKFSIAVLGGQYQNYLKKMKSTFFKNRPIFKCLAQMLTLGSQWHGVEDCSRTGKRQLPAACFPLLTQPCSAPTEMVTRRSAMFLLVGFKKSNITWWNKSNDFTRGVKWNNSGKDLATYCQRKLHTIYYFDILECV